MKTAEELRIEKVYAERAEDRARYCLRLPDVLYREQEIERALVKMLPSLEGKKILEVGCGEGKWLRQLIRLGADPGNLSGIDLLPAYIDRARATLPSAVRLSVGNILALGSPDQSVDMVLQFTVLSSILSADIRQHAARELMRVLKPHGCVVWYDMAIDNPWNSDIHGIGKDEIRELFPNCHYAFRRISLAAPIARKLDAYSIRGLQALRVLDSHYLAVITRQG